MWKLKEDIYYIAFQNWAPFSCLHDIIHLGVDTSFPTVPTILGKYNRQALFIDLQELTMKIRLIVCCDTCSSIYENTQTKPLKSLGFKLLEALLITHINASLFFFPRIYFYYLTLYNSFCYTHHAMMWPVRCREEKKKGRLCTCHKNQKEDAFCPFSLQIYIYISSCRILHH